MDPVLVNYFRGHIMVLLQELSLESKKMLPVNILRQHKNQTVEEHLTECLMNAAKRLDIHMFIILAEERNAQLVLNTVGTACEIVLTGVIVSSYFDVSRSDACLIWQGLSNRKRVLYFSLLFILSKHFVKLCFTIK